MSNPYRLKKEIFNVKDHPINNSGLLEGINHLSKN